MEFDPSEVQLQYLQAEEEIVFFGGGAGGGKTWASLVDNLQGVHDPHYFSVVFRTTTTEIDKGLWPEAKSLYEHLLKDDDGKYIGKSHISEQSKTITFPAGARTAFAYLSSDKDADSWYGSEICKIYFEEMQFRTYYQFDLLRSRNRSKAKVKCGIRCTLNPDPTHFSLEFVERFLDANSFPIKELSGKTAYFIIINDVLHTSWDREELKTKFGKNPQTYTYIPATVDDNIHLDDSYRDRLDSMSEKKRKQLLLGCWEPVEDTGMYFQRGDFRKASHVPSGCRVVRGWDTAASAPEEGQEINKKADWTVGVKVAKSRDGDYYVCGMERFQERSGPRDNLMMKAANRDGSDVEIVLAQDAGAAGKFQYDQFSKRALEEGFVCKKDPVPVNKSKVKKSEAASTALQNGYVYIVESAFEPKALQRFYTELELFDGERSVATKGKWDDIVDAFGSAMNYLAKSKVYRTPYVPEIPADTMAAPILSEFKAKSINDLEQDG
jgi:predicted phage terminase large subunit-like protein